MPADDADDAEKSVPSSNAVDNQEGDEVQDTLQFRRLYPIVRRKAHGFFKFIFSHRMIPLLKGTFTVTHPSALLRLD